MTLNIKITASAHAAVGADNLWPHLGVEDIAKFWLASHIMRIRDTFLGPIDDTNKIGFGRAIHDLLQGTSTPDVGFNFASHDYDYRTHGLGEVLSHAGTAAKEELDQFVRHMGESSRGYVDALTLDRPVCSRCCKSSAAASPCRDHPDAAQTTVANLTGPAPECYTLVHEQLRAIADRVSAIYNTYARGCDVELIANIRLAKPRALENHANGLSGKLVDAATDARHIVICCAIDLSRYVGEANVGFLYVLLHELGVHGLQEQGPGPRCRDLSLGQCAFTEGMVDRALCVAMTRDHLGKRSAEWLRDVAGVSPIKLRGLLAKAVECRTGAGPWGLSPVGSSRVSNASDRIATLQNDPEALTNKDKNRLETEWAFLRGYRAVDALVETLRDREIPSPQRAAISFVLTLNLFATAELRRAVAEYLAPTYGDVDQRLARSTDAEGLIARDTTGEDAIAAAAGRIYAGKTLTGKQVMAELESLSAALGLESVRQEQAGKLISGYDL